MKAMAGGRNFKESQLNRVIQSKRQPGSAFKPIIYAAALDKGYTPVSVINDSDVTYWNKETKKAWRPGNYDKKYYGPIRLRRAFALSRNIPAVRLLNAVGIDYTRKYARKLGITSDMNKGLSLALGASGVSLLELVTAYSVFTNLGDLVHPVFIRKITDRDGNEIQETNFQTEKVIEANTAYIMTNLLESVVRHGTGRRALALGRPAAGKTGTSSDLHDAWFVGYTPQYITGTWVGFDMERSLGNKETGSKAALPIWLSFMKKIHAEKPVMDFQVPEGVVFAGSECFKEKAVPAWYVKGKPDAIGESDLSESDFIARPKRLTSGQDQISPRTVIGLEQFFKSTM